jgi:hypothetical protein
VSTDRKAEIAHAVAAMTVQLRRGAATALRDQFIEALMVAGWSGEISVSPNQSGMTITSMKAGTGLCLQTGGNMSRIYADILKLQALYVDGVISCAVFVLPSALVARALGDNVAQADRLVRELAIFRMVITLPLLVYSLET